MSLKMMIKSTQKFIDDFYANHGPCCAGCDWWRYYSPSVGECIKSAPVSASERLGMIGMESMTLHIGAGHVVTENDHVCGDFSDE